jgi:hypothetical protein
VAFSFLDAILDMLFLIFALDVSCRYCHFWSPINKLLLVDYAVLEAKGQAEEIDRYRLVSKWFGLNPDGWTDSIKKERKHDRWDTTERESRESERG